LLAGRICQSFINLFQAGSNLTIEMRINRSSICLMFRACKKRLTIFMVLLLSAAPLQPVLADIAACADQHADSRELHGMAAMHHAVEQGAAMAAPCQHCDMAQSSDCHACDTGHCGVCSAHAAGALLGVSVLLPDTPDASLDVVAAQPHILSVYFSLSRPPKFI